MGGIMRLVLKLTIFELFHYIPSALLTPHSALSFAFS